MQNKWNKSILGDIITLNYGKSLPERIRKSGNVPVYGSGGISGYHNASLVKGPGIIVGRKGSIGTIQYCNEDFFPIDTVFYVTINKRNIDLKFIYYMLQQLNLPSLNTDAAVPGLNRDVAHSQKILYPDFPIQKKIAEVLSNYDDLIETNNKRIKILEEMAQKIYKEWFVDFKCPMCENVKFKQIELSKLLKIPKGKNITKSTIHEGDVPVVAAGLTPAYYHNKANTVAPVITISASGANAGYVNIYYQSIWASDCSYIDKNVTDNVYYYYLLLKNNQIEISKMQRGAAQPHVYPEDLGRLFVSDMPEKIIQKFEDIVSLFFEEIKNLSLKNKNLKQTRDILLPRLISGEIDVENLEIKWCFYRLIQFID